jgi:site-specific DNA recombinase
MDRVRDLVAAGGVSAVLAQDRDRFAREPAYHYLLKRELSEHGTKLEALNDRGDGSPEGELTDGILDQLAKYERAKIVERSRRGKLRKAREGKVIAGYRPTHGFRMNAARDGYEVDEEKMAVVQRVFRMVGAEGAGIYGVHKTLEREGAPAPGGGKYWDKRAIRRWIADDAYKPHTHEEVAELVRPEVAARLDPNQSYGIWWFNRRRTSLTQVSEPSPDGNGRVYRKVEKVAYRNKDEWIAVPIPDAGIPLEWVEAARTMLAQCRSPSRVDGRFWELSGALMRCGECGRAMEAMVKTARKKSGGKYVFCYYRCREGNRRRETCSNNKCIRSDRAHAAVWSLISELLSEPDRLREGLEAMIEGERKGIRGDPERESKAWLQKLAEVDRKRDGYLELAVEGFLGRDELRTKLAALEETRETAERELHALKGRSELLENLEHEKDAIIERYAGLVPEALEGLSPRERHQVYRMLHLGVVAHADATLEVNGAFSGDVLGTRDSLRMSSVRPRTSKVGCSRRSTTTPWPSF